MFDVKQQREACAVLLKNIKANERQLREWMNANKDRWGEEDMIYRFYHQSFKVYRIQGASSAAMEIFERIKPDFEIAKLNTWFIQIYQEGSGKKFDMSHNQRWLEETRPMLEAFWHCKYFVEMMLSIIEENASDPFFGTISSASASVLYLYSMR